MPQATRGKHSLGNSLVIFPPEATVIGNIYLNEDVCNEKHYYVKAEEMRKGVWILFLFEQCRHSGPTHIKNRLSLSALEKPIKVI